MPTKIIAGAAIAGSLLTGGSFVADAAINPYTQTDSAYVLPIDDPLNADAASSIAVATDAPAITLSKWGGQEQMTVAYDAPDGTGAVSRPFLSKDLNYTASTDQTVIMSPVDATTTMEGGGMEVDINLASEPTTNVFNFAIAGSDDMDFYYQPPLNEEMGSSTCTETDCGGSHRPENIVGSYAVYSADHKDRVEGETNYATGKLFQIFRPLVTDANGNTVWATLSYDQGVLSVTVPQDFLDSAAYPVVVDPTFGYTTIGGTQDTLNAIATVPMSVTFTSSAAGTITSISTYLNSNSGTPAVGMAFYADSAGAPGSKIATDGGATSNASTVAAWLTNNVSAAMSNATPYWLCFWVNGAGTSYYDTGVTNQTRTRNGQTFETWPATMSWNAANPRKTSIYATYTASGGGTTPTANPYDTVLFQ